jgi:hypothetical protein
MEAMGSDDLSRRRKKGEPKAGDYVLAAERVRAEAAASPHRSTAVDLARADKWERQARTKQLPSTRTEIGAGGELIDIESRWDGLGVVDTVADEMGPPKSQQNACF